MAKQSCFYSSDWIIKIPLRYVCTGRSRKELPKRDWFSSCCVSVNIFFTSSVNVLVIFTFLLTRISQRCLFSLPISFDSPVRARNNPFPLHSSFSFILLYTSIVPRTTYQERHHESQYRYWESKAPAMSVLLLSRFSRAKRTTMNLTSF
jgi:hypothetical protein